ncbi:MAG: NUDIX domain-containing protein [Ruminiclostridium sp.]|nr:NUDIX domain-containing protein [Ruminiclostridium sp.]
MVDVKFYDKAEDSLLKFAVIVARTEGKWIFCKHRQRDTYEIPGGHREAGESIFEAACRELREETGAIDFKLTPVCVYSVQGKNSINKNDEEESFGMLFYADVSSFEKELHHEIDTIIKSEKLVYNWTYPLIQPKLIEETRRRLNF